MCQGFVTSFRGLIACRFFLGFFEAGLAPGVLERILERQSQLLLTATTRRMHLHHWDVLQAL